MDFTTFKIQALRYLWRVGDTDLDTAMTSIVLTAEARIRNDLALHTADVSLPQAMTANPHPLPDDVDQLLSVDFPGVGAGVYLTPHLFVENEDAPDKDLLGYTIVGTGLRHCRPATVETPQDVVLTYQPILPSLTEDDDELYNAHRELFEKAVYREAEIYLRNEQRAQFFDSLYINALDPALIKEARRRRGGSPLKMGMPRRDVC